MRWVLHLVIWKTNLKRMFSPVQQLHEEKARLMRSLAHQESSARFADILHQVLADEELDKYHEPYFLFLRQRTGSKDLTVYRHTLPPTIPLTSLESLLNRNVPAYLDEIQDMLQAMVARREQVNQLSSQHSVESVNVNPFYTRISFTLRYPNIKHTTVQGYLVYDDIKLSHPTQVLLLQLHEQDQTTHQIVLEEQTRLFYTRDIDQATAEIKLVSHE
ncbi:hypothetical protein IWQ61_009903 [Dispira simplex]|nr:hypothetical protein IWQ61_009903 [Dispira simplex]